MNKLLITVAILTLTPFIIGFNNNYEHTNDFAKRMEIIKIKITE